jgi:hypothetical protein
MATIRLRNVPPSMSADKLELLLEDCNGGPFSDSPKITIDAKSREALVKFSDAAGGCIVLRIDLHTLNLFCRCREDCWTEKTIL